MWRRIVRSDWLFPGGKRLQLDEGHDGALLWACFTLESWRGLLGRREAWSGRPAELPAASPPSIHRAGDRAIDRVSPKALGER